MIYSQKTYRMKQRKQSIFVQPLDKPDIFYKDSVVYISEDRNDLPTKSPINDRRASYVSVHSVRFEGEKSHFKLFTMFANMLDLKVLTNCPFLLYVSGKVFSSLVIVVPYIYVPYMMTSHDILLSQASLAMSVLALTNGCGRLLCGLCTQYPDYVFAIQGTSGSIATVCILVLPNCSTTLHFYIITGIYGLAIAPLITLNTTALVRMVGMNGLSTAYGVQETIYGISNMVGPTLFGMAHDYFGNYQVPFYMAGACFGAGAVLTFVASKVHFRQKH